MISARILTASLVLVLSLVADGQVDPAQPTSKVEEGWILFNDNVGQDLGLSGDELQKLRDVDAKYQKEYMALGNAPMRSPGYEDLTTRREADIKALLTVEQYGRWKDHFRPSLPPQSKTGLELPPPDPGRKKP